MPACGERTATNTDEYGAATSFDAAWMEVQCTGCRCCDHNDNQCSILGHNGKIWYCTCICDNNDDDNRKNDRSGGWSLPGWLVDRAQHCPTCPGQHQIALWHRGHTLNGPVPMAWFGDRFGNRAGFGDYFLRLHTPFSMVGLSR